MKLKSMATKSIFATAILLSFSVNAAPSAAVQADKMAIDTACQAEAATAGCGKDVVGQGLLKCLHTYKQANKGAQWSAGCSAAIKQMGADKKAGK